VEDDVASLFQNTRFCGMLKKFNPSSFIFQVVSSFGFVRLDGGLPNAPLFSDMSKVEKQNTQD
jgi:hypothetical protein